MLALHGDRDVPVTGHFWHVEHPAVLAAAQRAG